MVDTQSRVEIEYNYEHFAGNDPLAEAIDFKRIVPVGTPAPDFSAVRLRDLATVRLSDYLGRGFVVLEFGSVT